MFRKKLTKNSDYNQGYFTPVNKDKYKGTWPIVYRSSLELKAYRWMDNNSNVISWGSESVIIPYRLPTDINEKVRRYFVDLVIHLKRKDNTIQKLLVEIKPSKQTVMPTLSNHKSKKTILYEQSQYLMNTSKWEAAQKWCEKNGYIFVILTEKDLNK